jgi:hypothetical protein
MWSVYMLYSQYTCSGNLTLFKISEQKGEKLQNCYGGYTFPNLFNFAMCSASLFDVNRGTQIIVSLGLFLFYALCAQHT